ESFYMLLNQHTLLSTKLILAIAILFGIFTGLTPKTFGATLQRETDKMIKKDATVEKFTLKISISSELLSNLVAAEKSISSLSAGESTVDLMTETVLEPSSLYFDWIISSLTQLNQVTSHQFGDVPTLLPVDASHIHKDLDNFEATSIKELTQPVGSNILSPIPSENTQGGTQASLLSQGDQWGDAQIDIFFASLPEAELTNVNTFTGTVDNTNSSKMVEQIDQSLDLNIDTQLNLMPTEIFRANKESSTQKGHL
ncbi:MAG: hypothetical protein AAGF26_03210, partial [Cyanobacteria bacterium P01_G01_bin.49]